MGIKGVTLIELLAATALVVIVVSSLSLFFPNATRATLMNGYITTAKNLAAEKIQQTKLQPYQYIGVTAKVDFTGTAAGSCDCNKQNLDDLTALDTTIINSTTFSRRICVNLVDRTTGPATWTALCADGSNDTGLKNIRVRVSWTVNNSQKSIDMESMVSGS